METFGALTKGARELIEQLAAYLAGDDPASLLRRRISCCLMRMIGAQLIARSHPPILPSLSHTQGRSSLSPRSETGRGRPPLGDLLVVTS